jgi:hypothetical protein
MVTLQIAVLVFVMIWVLPTRLSGITGVESRVLQILFSVSIQIFSRVNLYFFFISDIRQSSWVKLNFINIKVVMYRPIML